MEGEDVRRLWLKECSCENSDKILDQLHCSPPTPIKSTRPGTVVDERNIEKLCDEKMTNYCKEEIL